MLALATSTMLQTPAAWLVLDLETGDAPPEAVAAATEGWKPPSNVKDPEKIEARRQEAATKLLDKAALLDASPILCVALQTETLRIICNGMDDIRHPVQDWTVLPCGNERTMLAALRNFLDCGTGANTVLVGHNIRGFDLPKLRGAYLRHGLKLPAILRPQLQDEDQVKVMDTAALFKAFSMEHRDSFCPSLDTVAASFGIPRPKTYMTGADCPRLFREGQIATILTYCAVDVATTTRAYQLMTGDAPDLE